LTGRTDVDTGSAGSTHLGFDIKGSGYFAILSPVNKSNGPSIHLLSTHPHTQATIYAILMFYSEPYFIYLHLGSQVLNGFGTGAAGKKELHHHLSGLDYPLGMGSYFKTLFSRISAGGYQLGSIPFPDFHHTQATGAIRGETIMMTQGGNINAVEFCNLQDGPALLDLNIQSVECYSDHLFYLFLRNNIH
jgi:hypothetical protein